MAGVAVGIPRAIAQLRIRLQDNGLQVSGLQSLLYGKPDLQLLDRSTWPALLDHLRQVIGVAGALGAALRGLRLAA